MDKFELSVKRIKSDIKELRKAAGLSQTELGSKVGMKQPMVSRLEDQNLKVTSIKALKKLCSALGRSLVLSLEVADDSESVRASRAQKGRV